MEFNFDETAFENAMAKTDIRAVTPQIMDDRELYVSMKNTKERRLDFFSHLLRRLVTGEKALRQVPTTFGNHTEYVHTLFPLIVEDAVASVSSAWDHQQQSKGSMILTCRSLQRWRTPFFLASCQIALDGNPLRGNELVRLTDDTGLSVWGMTKNYGRMVDIVIYKTERDELPSIGKWFCNVVMETTSHLREYIAVYEMPGMRLSDILLGPRKKKRSSRKKKKDDEEDEEEDEDDDSDDDMVGTHHLNASQLAAVDTAVKRKEGLVLIQGPPGTGKTEVIVKILERLVGRERGGGILVCTPSNTAIDGLITRLLPLLAHVLPPHTRVLRVNAFGRGESCREFLLDTVAQPSADSIRDLRKAQYRSALKGAEDAAARGWHSYELDDVLDRCDAVRAQHRQSELSSRIDAIREADIVMCTLSMALSPSMERASARFSTVIVDEAAQAVEATTLVPLVYGCSRLLLIGDPCQLPATVRSVDALEHGYARSLFERLKEGGVPVHLLDTQYRMHPQIRVFPARYFYEDKLKDHITTTEEVFYDRWYYAPYVVFNMRSGSAESVRGTSVCNDVEAQFAVRLLTSLLQDYHDIGVKENDMTILTPYRAQIDCLKHEMSHHSYRFGIGTVDGFQGRESDIVVLSCVRTASSSSSSSFGYGATTARPQVEKIGFLSDRRRMNVALTRARRALWVVGDVDTLRTNADWEELVVDAERRGSIVDVAFDKEGGFELTRRYDGDKHTI